MAMYDGRIQAEVFGECKTCGKREPLGTGAVVKLSWVACKALLIKRGWKLLNFCKFQCPDCQKAEEARRRGETMTETRRRDRGVTEVGHLSLDGKWVPELTMSLIDGYWTPVSNASAPRPFTHHAMPEDYRRARMSELRPPAYAEDCTEDDEGVSDG